MSDVDMLEVGKVRAGVYVVEGLLVQRTGRSWSVEDSGETLVGGLPTLRDAKRFIIDCTEA